MSSSPITSEHFEFNELVFTYQLHQKLMQLHFAPNQPEEPKLRPLEPTDVAELSEVEMAGLMYWVEQQKGYSGLCPEEQGALLQKYAVRKISLDHFYSAAKHPERCAKREFVMNNYTFVPADRTGFETVDDDEQQIRAKREIHSRTFNRFWANIIDPFVLLQITDAEIVFLHVMLLWSPSNSANVTPATSKFMESRRCWAKENLERFYSIQKVQSAEERLQKMLEFVDELEIIADMHIEDFMAAKALEIKIEEPLECEELYYAPEKNSEDRNSDSENRDPNEMVKQRKENSDLKRAPLPDDELIFADGTIL